MDNLYLAFQLHERVLSLEKLVASHQLQLSVVKSELATMQHDIDIINAVKHQLISNHEKVIDYEQYGPDMQDMLDEVA